jgi:hypothetical protein
MISTSVLPFLSQICCICSPPLAPVTKATLPVKSGISLLVHFSSCHAQGFILYGMTLETKSKTPFNVMQLKGAVPSFNEQSGVSGRKGKPKERRKEDRSTLTVSNEQCSDNLLFNFFQDQHHHFNTPYTPCQMAADKDVHLLISRA